FDFGEVRVRQAEATYMQAANRLLELAVNVRSQARDAYRIYRSSYDLAGHYQREVLPLRKIISDETLLRYNAMLIDVFSLLAGASAISGRVQAASIPEAPTTKATTMQPPIFPSGGPDYQPVVTLNGWTLPWRMNGDWKEFHLVAEPVVREFAPGMKVNLWG